MTSLSKYLYWPLLALVLLSAPALAQTTAPPGWGWVRTLNDLTSPSIPSSYNRTAGMGRDAVGNLYVAGAYIGYLTAGPAPGPYHEYSDVFLAKYDPAGTLLWIHAMRSPDTDAAMQLVVAPNGRCTLTGYYGSGPTGGNLDFSEFGSSLVLLGPAQAGLSGGVSYGALPFVAAVNADGSLAWATCPAISYSFLWNELVNPHGLAIDAQGNAYISLTAAAPMFINGLAYQLNGPRDAVLLKLAAGSGQVQWVRQAGAASTQVYGQEVEADLAGNVYWLVSHNNPFTFDMTTVGAGSTSTLIKLASATSQVQWVKSNLLQVGSAVSAGWNISGFDSATGALYLYVASSDQNITYPGASTPVVISAGNNATTFCIARCEATGQVSWVKPLLVATPSNGQANSVFIATPRVYPTTTGFVALTSTANGAVTSFAGSAITYPASGNGQTCVLSYNTSTNQTAWVRTAGTLPGTPRPSSYLGTSAVSAALNPAGNVYVAGLYLGPAQFGSITLPATGDANHTFLAKLDQSVLATKAAAATGKAWQPYPNPATGTVHLGGLPAKAQVQLLDALGRPVRQTTAADLNLSGLAPGLYLLQVSGTTEPYQSQRLTVE